MAFTKVTGTLVDIGDLDLTNVGQIQLDSIAGDADANTSITFSGSDVITIATGGSGRLTIGDGALSPVTDNQIDLGTSSLEFKDAFFDGTVTSDAFAGPLTGDVTGNVSGTAATVTTAAQPNITSLGTLTGLTVNGATVFNENSADVDFRVESNDSANMLSIDGGDNTVSINANNTDSVTNSATALAARTLIINGNEGEGSDNLSFFAMADGTGNYGMEVSNSAHTAQYDLLINPIMGGNVGIGTTSATTLLHAAKGSNGSGLIDVARFQNTGTTVNDGARIQLTAGASTSGAGIGCLGDALNSAHLVFHAGGNTERMRITSGGVLSIGDATPESGDASAPTSLYLQGGEANMIIKNTDATSSSNRQGIAFLNSSGTRVGTITINSSATGYVTSSDYRLKENVTDMTNATTRLKELKPKRFNWIADETNTLVDGFLAHEVSNIVPEAVVGDKDGAEMQGIDQSKLVPLLVKTIQEQQTIIEDLKTRIETLEG